MYLTIGPCADRGGKCSDMQYPAMFANKKRHRSSPGDLSPHQDPPCQPAAVACTRSNFFARFEWGYKLSFLLCGVQGFGGVIATAMSEEASQVLREEIHTLLSKVAIQVGRRRKRVLQPLLPPPKEMGFFLHPRLDSQLLNKHLMYYKFKMLIKCHMACPLQCILRTGLHQVCPMHIIFCKALLCNDLYRERRYTNKPE